MTLVVWKDKFSVQIKSIDDQHKKLFMLLNDFYDNITNRSNTENISILLESLKKYVVEHFCYEEKYMKLYHFHSYNSHKREHEFFISKINEFEDKFKSGKTVLSLDISSFLYNWLQNHIQFIDKDYSQLFIENGLK